MHDPRVSLTVLDNDSWYSHVSLQGRAVSIEQDPDLSVIDRVSRHYTGADYSARGTPSCSVPPHRAATATGSASGL